MRYEALLAELLEMIERGATIEIAARTMGIPLPVARLMVRSATRPSTSSRAQLNEAEAVRLYRDEMLTAGEVAQRMGHQADAISAALRRTGPLRKPMMSHKEIMDVIRLRSEKMSDLDIARQLNLNLSAVARLK